MYMDNPKLSSFVIRVTRRVSRLKQEPLTPPEHLVVSENHVAQSFVF